MATGRVAAQKQDARAYGRREVQASARRLADWAKKAPRGRPDEEYIHELRVRLRRARAAMRAFRRFYANRAQFERRVAPLRRLSRTLGPMRDADVTAALLEEVLRTVPYPPRSISRALVAHHNAQEARWKRVRHAIEAVAAVAPAALAPPPLAARAKGGRKLGKHARRSLEGRGKAVRALEAAVVSGDPADLHALRIAVKRLRYTIEAFAPTLGPAGRVWLARLRDLQSTLGLVQDHTVALRQVDRHLASAREPLERASLELVRRIIDGRRAAHIERFRWQWRAVDPRGLAALTGRP